MLNIVCLILKHVFFPEGTDWRSFIKDNSRFNKILAYIGTDGSGGAMTMAKLKSGFVRSCEMHVIN